MASVEREEEEEERKINFLSLTLDVCSFPCIASRREYERKDSCDSWKSLRIECERGEKIFGKFGLEGQKRKINFSSYFSSLSMAKVTTVN